jgi:hypothetical protein
MGLPMTEHDHVLELLSVPLKLTHDAPAVKLASKSMQRLLSSASGGQPPVRRRLMNSSLSKMASVTAKRLKQTELDCSHAPVPKKPACPEPEHPPPPPAVDQDKDNAVEPSREALVYSPEPSDTVPLRSPFRPVTAHNVSIVTYFNTMLPRLRETHPHQYYFIVTRDRIVATGSRDDLARMVQLMTEDLNPELTSRCLLLDLAAIRCSCSL